MINLISVYYYLRVIRIIHRNYINHYIYIDQILPYSYTAVIV